jgi:hypothetical protein
MPDDAPMAKTTVTQITDDLDGTPNAETYRFAWQSHDYEIDLSNKNFKAFDKLLQPYIRAAVKVPKRSSGRRAPSAASRRDLSAVRAWAKTKGYDVSDRGRVPRAIVEAYDAAH